MHALSHLRGERRARDVHADPLGTRFYGARERMRPLPVHASFSRPEVPTPRIVPTAFAVDVVAGGGCISHVCDVERVRPARFEKGVACR